MSGRVLVTGAAGFIGGHCCRALLDAGYAVVGLDNFDPFYARKIKEETLAELRRDGAFRFVEGDIRRAADVLAAVEGVEVVVHLAARAGVRPSIEHPGLYASINVEGTARLLDACRRHGIRRFVFGSSSSVYGDATPVPFREEAPAVDPVSPYGATKRAGELLCRVFAHLYGMRIAALRLFTVYGPRQRPDLAIHKFTRLISRGEPIEQYGDGESARDYTHVSDIVQGILGAVRWTGLPQPAFEIYNLGESRTVTLRELIERLSAALGTEPVVRRLPPQPGDVRRTWADITKAQRDLGYRPQVPLEVGIPEFVHWFRGSDGT